MLQHPTLPAPTVSGWWRWWRADYAPTRLMPNREVGRLPHDLTYAAGDAPAARRPRALVVDDAPDVTEMIATLMQYAGYEVVMVYSGPQALDAARAERFDVIVSDIGMPGMNGYELAELLRALPDYEVTPMVAVTGFTMYDDRDRAFDSGFNAFLTKPINPADLINLVNSLR